eukprot:GILK01004025.1.p1 GENE.GILK01004025.1~~GILK01004025.1.p1  ORF type:complete len:771 (+),score=121.68 GILK01004025.1:88-2400(+)
MFLKKWGQSAQNLLKQLGEHTQVNAPRRPPTQLEEFRRIWEDIQAFYQSMIAHGHHQGERDPLDDATLLERSPVPALLYNLVRILCDESELNKSSADPGPCLEFLLNKRCLDHLCAYGQTDRPPGMLALVLQTLDGMFTGIRQPLLPHMSVHFPVSQLLRVIVTSGLSGVQFLRARHATVNVLHTLAHKLRDDPGLLGFFYDETGRRNNSEFLLFSALLLYLEDERREDRTKTHEAVLCCLQLPGLAVAEQIALHSRFCSVVVKRLVSIYNHFPRELDVEAAAEFLGFGKVGGSSDPLLKAYREQIEWIDQIARVSNTIVAKHLATHICEEFLTAVVAPHLMETSEDKSRTATIYLKEFVQKVHGDAIVKTMVLFLFGADSTPEVRAVEGTFNPNPSIRDTLIHRMDSLNEDLSVATLQLFDALLSRHHWITVNSLVLRNLRTKAHLSNTKYESGAMVPASSIIALIPKLSMSLDDDSLREYVLDAQKQISRCLDTFGMWEEGHKTSSKYHRLSVEDEYQAVYMGNSLAKSFSRPSSVQPSPATSPSHHPSPSPTNVSSAISSISLSAMSNPQSTETVDSPHNGQNGETDLSSSPTADSTSEQPADEFYEGVFLEVLFNKLERLLSTSLVQNVLVTGLFARLACYPAVGAGDAAELLHSYILDPECPLKPHVRALPRVLQQVIAEADARAPTIPDFTTRLKIARRGLNVEAHKPHPAESMIGDLNDEAKQKFIEGYVVLQEFGKELCGIAKAKEEMHALSQAAAQRLLSI